jgi:hypothetical protein
LKDGPSFHATVFSEKELKEKFIKDAFQHIGPLGKCYRKRMYFFPVLALRMA